MAWATYFPAAERSCRDSDADCEAEKPKQLERSAKSQAQGRSEPSSSDPESLSEDAGPATEDDVVATLGAAALIGAEPSEASDTTDEEEAWVNPMFWDFQLARHKAWFTIHAVENNQRLLCGRPLDQGFERVVNPPDALPVCRFCRARVRGRVEAARR